MAEQTNLELAAANKLIADLSARLAALEAAGKAVPAAPGAPAAYKPSARKPYKKVLYHGNHVQPTIMNVLDENEDGTVTVSYTHLQPRILDFGKRLARPTCPPFPLMFIEHPCIGFCSVWKR